MGVAATLGGPADTAGASGGHFDCGPGGVGMPDATEPKAWRPRADWARRGEMSKDLLRHLRRASAPICNRDIALAFHEGARHGIPTTGGWSRCSPSGSGCCLRQHRDAGRGGVGGWAGADDSVAAGKIAGHFAAFVLFLFVYAASPDTVVCGVIRRNRATKWATIVWLRPTQARQLRMHF